MVGASMLNDFLVGCDPEFGALDGSGVQMNLARHFRSNGEIGYDHGGRVGEFRPEPTKGTYALVKKLHRIINSPVLAAVGAAKLKAGARIGNDSLGGHVHFGTSPQECSAARLLALNRLTLLFERLDILPQAESTTRRQGGYGRLSDIRDSGGHLEYRTMASWLLDPKVAFLCLTGAKLAYCDWEGTAASLEKVTSFEGLGDWFRRYRTKDINARRVVDRIVPLGHKAVQVYPDVDFRENWRQLGI
jgi:Phage phiEco32-like COOH.NH2 ligase-type 2